MSRSKYAALGEYLNDIAGDRDEVVLTFAEIEEVVGDLPFSARTYKSWWSHSSVYAHCRAIERAGWKLGAGNLEAGTGRFIRAGDGTPSRSRVSYDHIGVFLESLPLDRTQVAFTFDQVADLRGAPLPQIAFRSYRWWATYESSAYYWPSIHWEVQDIFFQARTVVFRRKQSDALPAIKQYVRFLLDGGTVTEAPNAWQLLEWMRLCRQVGWYFEAVVLMDHSAESFHSLGDAAISEIQMIDAACRRATYPPPGTPLK